MNSYQQGVAAEQAAAHYIELKGYRIIEQRFRSRFGEIDLIAQDGETLVFIEVKYRKGTRTLSPAETVTAAKQRKICLTARYYLSCRRQVERACRFDVIELWQENGYYRARQIENAFEAE